MNLTTTYIIIIIIILLLIFCITKYDHYCKNKKLENLPTLDTRNGCMVYPNIYLGNAKFASDIDLLKSLGITHIINAAIETPNYFTEFKYLHLEMYDGPQENAKRYFQTSKQFIDDALHNNGKVLIHCWAGISRSTTILTYYLMKTLNISLEEALKIIRKCRPIANPNYGFIKQLQTI
jgi:protein-tyrosine phosphatase